MTADGERPQAAGGLAPNRPDPADPGNGAVDAAVSAAGGAADYIVLLLVAIFAYELIARNLFNAPSGFADQLAAYTLPAIAFLALARSLRAGGHVTVTLVAERLGERARSRLWTSSVAVEAVVCIVIAAFATLTVIESYEDGVQNFIGTWLVYEYIPQLVIPVGFFLAFVECLRQLYRARIQPRAEQDGTRGP